MTMNKSLVSSKNINNRSQIKILSQSGLHRDFIDSRERESYNISRGYTTIGSAIPGSQLISGRDGKGEIVKIPALLSSKKGGGPEFMALRNSRMAKDGRNSALTNDKPGGIRSGPSTVITNGE
jgi:hypothetical protein